jgi:SHS2 domain-containing protein
MSEREPAGAEYEELDHTADWAYRVRAATLPGLFVAAARALYDLAGVRLADGPRVERAVALEAVDAESLLVAWLNELLYLYELEGLAFDDFAIDALAPDEPTPTSIASRLRGAPAAEWGKYVKAVTYHDLSIRRTAAGYETTLVLDV